MAKAMWKYFRENFDDAETTNTYLAERIFPCIINIMVKFGKLCYFHQTLFAKISLVC